jgi:hypothetical protein
MNADEPTPRHDHAEGVASKVRDFDLLDHSLAKTPWDRKLDNDDALRFGELLRQAVRKHNAEPH